MKNQKLMFIAGLVGLGLVGCASIPPAEELTQLNGEELKSRLIGNTWVSKFEWGTWAEYYPDGNSGFAKASGDWGTEEATSTYVISADGEGCWTYEGEAEWAQPEQKYCGVVLVDTEDNTYSKSTVNTNKPERVGKLRRIQIKPGDVYGLAE